MGTHSTTLHCRDDLSEQGQLREVVRRLGETFNDPQIRESSYFDFYDDSLVISGFPQNLPANKEGTCYRKLKIEFQKAFFQRYHQMKIK
jgi:hypothetical protein